MNKILVTLAGALLISLLAYGALSLTGQTPQLGSAVVGNDYSATSTAPSSLYGATISTRRRIKTGPGSLSTVVITGANTGYINLYDATTSDVTQRTNQPASSTILLASFPPSATVGDYVIDVSFSYGLYIDISGTVPTTTITYR